MRTYLEACPCGSGKEAEALFDGYGIFLTYACDKCEKKKLAGYRPDIMEAYECDEPIEAEDY
jgi:hypothetical protein